MIQHSGYHIDSHWPDRNHDIRVRLYQYTDLAAVDTIESVVFGDEDRYPAFFFTQLLEIFGDGFLVATCAEELIGYVVAVLDARQPGRGWILSLGVVPGHRRLKAATLLMASAEQYLLERNCTEAAITVDPDNAPALDLYTQRGYQPIAHRRDYFGPGEDRLVAVANLTVARAVTHENGRAASS